MKDDFRISTFDALDYFSSGVSGEITTCYHCIVSVYYLKFKLLFHRSFKHFNNDLICY